MYGDNRQYNRVGGDRYPAWGDVIEEDIRVTRDGVPILAHDDHLPSVDGTWHSLSEMTYEEILHYPLL
ncbi:glycerophosphodiester phosphodiesterase family protein [Paenibacillus vulneris]|uniref:Glycerophosphodiester phosphodiesterase family protein n=1 Tax=Paenibacillus vulneris TaxID=1133364 RepID=A0ABW3UMQ2_9BACL